MDTRYNEYKVRRHHSGLGFGVVAIVIGALLLLDNLGIFYIHDLFRFWPVALIALGLVKALDARNSHGQIGGGVLILVGAWLLADRLDLFFFPFRFHQFWPVLLIAFGVFLLWQYMERPNYETPPEAAGDMRAVFGGGKRRVTGDFTGGKVEVVFGGYEIDLRSAQMAADEAVLAVNAVFGGIEITIPEHWSASVQGKAVFGGFEDKTHQPLPGTPGLKRLVIVGEAVFGGVTVKN